MAKFSDHFKELRKNCLNLYKRFWRNVNLLLFSAYLKKKKYWIIFMKTSENFETFDISEKFWKHFDQNFMKIFFFNL